METWKTTVDEQKTRLVAAEEENAKCSKEIGELEQSSTLAQEQLKKQIETLQQQHSEQTTQLENAAKTLEADKEELISLIQRYADETEYNADVYDALSGLVQKISLVEREPEPVFEYMECPVVYEIE